MRVLHIFESITDVSIARMLITNVPITRTQGLGALLTTCLCVVVTRTTCLHPALCDSTYKFDTAQEKRQSARDDSTAYDPVTQWVMVHV